MVPETGLPVENSALSEQDLRRQIEEYYLPRQLVEAIFENGEIPNRSVVQTVGIGFIDIADYSYLSRFLSPDENQALLNGLYAAFNAVLRRYGGYLNKIEGDSLMFHYGGLVDASVRQMSEDEAVYSIAARLFYSCIEMQRVCLLFNRADDRFLEEHRSPQDAEMLRRAFDIMERMRGDMGISESLKAFFQIRIRIGAHIGTVTVGNFGPAGARQWDVVGEPVIKAKRMETTAPVGGFRMSADMFNTLQETGIVEEYLRKFRFEAREHNSTYQNIQPSELFREQVVTIREKKNVAFKTISVQVHPDLPETISEQVTVLLLNGEQGADRILELLKYYRGNKYVVDAVENTLLRIGVGLRKAPMIRAIFPSTYTSIVKRGYSSDELDQELNSTFSLVEIFGKLGEYQDALKDPDQQLEIDTAFSSYEQYIDQCRKAIEQQYARTKRIAIQRAYFFNVVYPLVFESMRAGILEYHYRTKELPAVETA
ncbi:MAG: adenylate/guanylate cyclase domain-containing protein [Spirochaetaceae bacterium]|nr:MAG: adenylate/guanylate cyclase domain-containing protein [Spirochaetaceae bacterium]